MVTAGRHRLELLRSPRQCDGRRSVMKRSVLTIGLDPVFAVLHLTSSERVFAGSRVHLVQLPQAERPEEPAHGLGLAREWDPTLSPPPPANCLPPGRLERLDGGNSRKEPGAESRKPASVRVKPKGRTTRPHRRPC